MGKAARFRSISESSAVSSLPLDIVIIILIAAISWFVGAPDPEVFGSTYYSTKATYSALFNDEILTWYSKIGLGTPGPFLHHLIPHPFAILSVVVDPLLFVIIIYVVNSAIAIGFLRKIFSELGTPDSVHLVLIVCYLLLFVSFNQILIKTTPSSHFAWSILPAVSLYVIRITFFDFKLRDCIYLTFWLVVLGISVHPSIILSYGLPFLTFVLFSSVRISRIKAFFSIGLVFCFLISPRFYELFILLYNQDEVARKIHTQEFDVFILNNYFVGIFPFFSFDEFSLKSIGKAIVSGGEGTAFD